MALAKVRAAFTAATPSASALTRSTRSSCWLVPV